MSRLTRDGTAEPLSRDQILRREREEGNIHFACVQLTTSRIGDLTWLIHALVTCNEYTYKHTLLLHFFLIVLKVAILICRACWIMSKICTMMVVLSALVSILVNSTNLMYLPLLITLGVLYLNQNVPLFISYNIITFLVF